MAVALLAARMETTPDEVERRADVRWVCGSEGAV
jgi:hypothetical protein